MTTMKDIAQALGISVKTVSRVINNEKYVNEETRTRVWECCKAREYSPNQLARSLATKKTNTIGVLVSNVSNPFFSEVAKGIEKAVRECGYSLLMATAETYEDAINGLRVLLEKRVDGIIIYTMGFQSETGASGAKLMESFMSQVESTARQATKSGVYFTLINWQDADERINSVCGSNLTGSSEMTEHLLCCGHRRIGYITGHITPSMWDAPNVKPWDVWNARYAGFMRTLQKHGLVPAEGCVVEAQESFEGGYNAMQQLMKLAQPPSAVYAANDILALGALYAAQEQGLRVPEEVSIVGFDGIDAGAMVWPKLTTMRHDRYKLGAMAVRFLIDTIQDPSIINHAMVRPSFAEGGSLCTNAKL